MKTLKMICARIQERSDVILSGRCKGCTNLDHLLWKTNQENKQDRDFAKLTAEVKEIQARTDVRIAELETRLIKWMVGMIGVMLAILRALLE